MSAAPRRDHAPVIVSSFCTGGGCVGVVGADTGVSIVDTKLAPGASAIRLSPEEWAAFVTGVKNGELDL